MQQNNLQDQLEPLIARCALGDQLAFQALYQATSAKLFAVSIRILKSEARAEEALQEAYLKIWHAAESYSTRRGKPMTWLINIVRNQSLDLLRASTARQEDKTDPLDVNLIANDNPLDESEISDELRRLLDCLRPLSAAQRDCILLSYHAGYTPSEIAHRRAWPLGSVKTWLRRGLASVRECLSS